MKLLLDLPEGSYRAEWFNTKSGNKDKTAEVKSTGKPQILDSPSYSEDIALRIKRL